MISVSSSPGLCLDWLEMIDSKDRPQENNKRHFTDRTDSIDIMSISELSGWIGITIMRNQNCCNLWCSNLTIKLFWSTYQVARKQSIRKLPRSFVSTSSIRILRTLQNALTVKQLTVGKWFCELPETSANGPRKFTTVYCSSSRFFGFLVCSALTFQ